MLMKKFFVISLLTMSAIVHSNSWDDPNKRFDATKNFTYKTEITWRIVDDPAKECNRESRKRFKNFNGFGYEPEACAIWEKDKCLIITSKRPTMHELGHEIRHCFQGHWH